MDEMRTQRYRRHDLIDWFSQERVAAARIAVIGAGAVGNEVVKNLVLLGVGAIDVFDFDVVELHNLTRSVLRAKPTSGAARPRRSPSARATSTRTSPCAASSATSGTR